MYVISKAIFPNKTSENLVEEISEYFIAGGYDGVFKRAMEIPARPY
jgi:hypothetical protein